MKRFIPPIVVGLLVCAWLGYHLNEWVSCKTRGGEWLRSPMSFYECRGAK